LIDKAINRRLTRPLRGVTTKSWRSRRSAAAATLPETSDRVSDQTSRLARQAAAWRLTDGAAFGDGSSMTRPPP
jgi:hypothetical protein